MSRILLSTSLLLLALTGCSKELNQTEAALSARTKLELTTFKSASCGCCGQWVAHARASDFVVDARNVDDLNAVKNRHHIDPRLQSCHTSVSRDGYVFEGHVPAKLIRRFLQNPPAGARGLAVPAMPLGSPGMEVGERFTPYNVMLLHSDGSDSVYARIDSIEQQH
ncbi:DUF411 domain-containing protein [Microbulbifer sp. SAOS-129_SWC]|uniref:DUF411 domain-containing protein n=1 Tax=Microbulbifer sp. SAOS-129_SWC TaxID=3145235 RepID=UPI0032169DB9